LRQTILGLARLGFRNYQKFSKMIIESTNVKLSTKAPLLPNPFYAVGFFF
jgi:hypothetical protein